MGIEGREERGMGGKKGKKERKRNLFKFKGLKELELKIFLK